MKALCIADVHAKVGFLPALKNYLAEEKPDMILFVGDIVNQGRDIEYLKEFDKIIKKSRTALFWVPGNNDVGPVYELMKKRDYSVEGEFVEYGGEKIIGMDGVPDLWGHGISYPDVPEKDIAGSIFLSHIPPKNFRNLKKTDHEYFDESVELINAPKIQISGHQHSYWGVAYIGKTKLLKLPDGLSMMAATLDTKTLAVEFINLSYYK